MNSIISKIEHGENLLVFFSYKGIRLVIRWISIHNSWTAIAAQSRFLGFQTRQTRNCSISKDKYFFVRRPHIRQPAAVQFNHESLLLMRLTRENGVFGLVSGRFEAGRGSPMVPAGWYSLPGHWGHWLMRLTGQRDCIRDFTMTSYYYYYYYYY